MTFAEWFNSLHSSTKSFLVVCVILSYFALIAAIIYGFYYFIYLKENFSNFTVINSKRYNNAKEEKK